MGVNLVDKFKEDYYTFQLDIDKCPKDVCEREKCPKGDLTEVFKILKVDTNDGFKFVPEMND